jgi:mannose-1-phosphate guanylyltransferase
VVGQGAYLAYYKIKTSEEYVGNVLVDPSSVIEEGCKIGPNVVIGPNCRIKKGARLK